MTKRTNKGTFAKGKSGNPSGRPKKVVEQPVENTYGDDPMKALLYLLENARTKDEVFKYSKELMPYCKPKLSSVQSEVKQERTVTIQIEGFQPLELEDKSKVIDGDFSVEDLEDKAAAKIEEIGKKKGS